MLAPGESNVRFSVAMIDLDQPQLEAAQLLLERARLSVRSFPSLESLVNGDPSVDCLLVAHQRDSNTGEMLATLAQHRVHSPLVYLARSARPSQVATAIKAGAFDFLQWPDERTLLVGRIRSAIDAKTERSRLRSRLAPVLERIRVLSKREREVMHLVARGHANKVISDHLGISHRTVEVHRANAMKKMGAHSPTELVLMDLTVRYCAQPPARDREYWSQGLQLLLEGIALDEDTIDSRRVA